MEKPAPVSPPTADERMEAMEYLLGQILLALETDSFAIHERLARLESAIEKMAPGRLPPLSEESAGTDAFSMDALSDWVVFSLERMRSHRSASARQMVAIGELTARVIGLGESLTQEPPPAIGPDAHAALEKAKRPPRST